MSSLEVSFELKPGNGLTSTDSGIEQIVVKEPISDRKDRYSPTQFLLFGMSGCTSGDVISILSKMRQDYTSFKVKTTAQREEEHPKVVRFVNIHFFLEGNLVTEKVRKAINLSLTKYCSVSILAIRGGADVRYSLTINGKDIDTERRPDPDLATIPG